MTLCSVFRKETSTNTEKKKFGGREAKKSRNLPRMIFFTTTSALLHTARYTTPKAPAETQRAQKGKLLHTTIAREQEKRRVPAPSFSFRVISFSLTLNLSCITRSTADPPSKSLLCLVVVVVAVVEVGVGIVLAEAIVVVEVVALVVTRAGVDAVVVALASVTLVVSALAAVVVAVVLVVLLIVEGVGVAAVGELVGSKEGLVGVVGATGTMFDTVNSFSSITFLFFLLLIITHTIAVTTVRQSIATGIPTAKPIVALVGAPGRAENEIELSFRQWERRREKTDGNIDIARKRARGGVKYPGTIPDET